jgi:hypothetical protein
LHNHGHYAKVVIVKTKQASYLIMLNYISKAAATLPSRFEEMTSASKEIFKSRFQTAWRLHRLCGDIQRCASNDLLNARVGHSASFSLFKYYYTP